MTRSHVSAGLLAIGDELMLGQSRDTNSAWLAGRLSDAGILVREITVVPDDLGLQTEALRRLGQSCDLVISTGGLGPTPDDLTRQALAHAADDELVEDPEALAQIKAFFDAHAMAMPAINRLQALRPLRSDWLPNHVGTAPGLHTKIGEADVFCLPGPPAEMQPMFDRYVFPRLRPTPGRTVRTRVLHCVGIGESRVAMMLGPLMDRTRNPLIGTTASAGIVSVRIRYDGPAMPAQAEELLDEAERSARAVIGDFIFGTGEESLERTVLSMLKVRGETLACVESCTGGLLSTRITDVPGASAAYLGAIVAYSNAAKMDLAGVESPVIEFPGPGAVSAECARALATAGRVRFHATHALAITGIAGPDGAVPARGNVRAKPLGTVYIARSSPGDEDVRRFEFPGDRSSVRMWSAMTALGMLRFHLAGMETPRLLRQVDD
jgi:nicotinamide-nucleotide amidase